MRAKDVHIYLSVDLAFLGPLWRGEGWRRPVVLRFRSLILSGVRFNMMMGATGKFNLPWIGKTINEYESGKAIPNNGVIAKIERALGVKLPRAPKK